MIVREEQSSRGFLQPDRQLEHFLPLRRAERRARNIARKIERIDVGKTPRLIFAIRVGKRFELRPGRPLLIAEPGWKLSRARLERTGKNRGGGWLLRRFEFHGFVENGCLVSHSRRIRRRRRPETAALALVLGAER